LTITHQEKRKGEEESREGERDREGGAGE